VDGVLVETSGSFQRTALETVRHFTKKRVTPSQFHAWKNRPGFNDDWKLCTTWVNQLGVAVTFEQIQKTFQEFYWGDQNTKGFVDGEKWLLPIASFQRLARKHELAIFTGRYHREMEHTLKRNDVRAFFSNIMTVEKVTRTKPDPEGLLKILNGRDPQDALYLGDNIDDALAAQAAGVPFVGILPRKSAARRHRGPTLKKLGAITILGHIRELEAYLKKQLPSARS
jgi:HAD superfamily phosphatase